MMAYLIALICPAGTCVEERDAEQVPVNGVEEAITKGKCLSDPDRGSYLEEAIWQLFLLFLALLLLP